MTTDFSKQRQEKYQQALKQNYTGCLFDIDGTLTIRGDEFMPGFMHQPLAEMALRAPMGVCTARRFSHAYEKLAPMFMKSSNPLKSQENWILICENGGIGYVFDPVKKKYEEFFRVDFFYDNEQKNNIYEQIKSALGDKLGVSFQNEVSLVFRPIRLDDTDREELAKRSHELAMMIKEILPKYDPKSVLRIGDSGIGVVVFPYTGNKENGTAMFAKYLSKKNGHKFSPNLQEIVVVGDQPIPGGNDEFFLDGKYGTPFTVGEVHPQNLLPLPVYKSDNEIIKGPQGTLTLLQQLHFNHD